MACQVLFCVTLSSSCNDCAEVSDKLADQPESKPHDKIPGEGEAIILESPSDILDRQEADRRKRDGEYKQRQLTIAERQVGITKWLAVLTLFLVVGNGVYDYLMWHQSETGRIAAVAAQESAAAASNAARIAGNALLSSKESAQATLGQMKAQSRAMQDAAGAAKTQAGTSIISANAAKNAAETARDALVRVQRPWVGLDGSPTIETTPDWYSYSARLKNFGIAPALKVGVSIRRPTTDDFQKEMDKTCEEAKAHPFTYIMPGQPYPYRTPHSFYLGGDNSVRLVGCVTYFGQFGGLDFHRTPFCFTSGVPISKTTAESLVACPIKYDVY